MHGFTIFLLIYSITKNNFSIYIAIPFLISAVLYFPILVLFSFDTFADVRIAVKGGSEEPRDEWEEAEDDDAGGDDIASFGMIGLPKLKIKI